MPQDGVASEYALALFRTAFLLELFHFRDARPYHLQDLDFIAKFRRQSHFQRNFLGHRAAFAKKC